MFKPFAQRESEEMKDVLMNSNDNGPSVHYYMIRGGKDKTNITVLEPGLVGDEYIKTYGHYHVGDLSETYSILQGTGAILLQKRKKDANGKPLDNEIEFFKVIYVKPGDKVFIEQEVGHLVVNTGDIWLVLSDDSPVNIDDSESSDMPGHADYEPVKKMGGFAYFLTKKDSASVLVKNSKYVDVPEAYIE